MRQAVARKLWAWTQWRNGGTIHISGAETAGAILASADRFGESLDQDTTMG